MFAWLSQFKRRLAPRVVRGKQAEHLAAEALRRAGYQILERNARYPVGEIDLIAQEGPTRCFIEVRSTGSQQWGGPLATITDRKRQRLIAAAVWYLHYAPEVPLQSRFDVVAVDWGAAGAPHVEIVRNAFTADRPK